MGEMMPDTNDDSGRVSLKLKVLIIMPRAITSKLYVIDRPVLHFTEVQNKLAFLQPDTNVFHT